MLAQVRRTVGRPGSGWGVSQERDRAGQRSPEDDPVGEGFPLDHPKLCLLAGARSEGGGIAARIGPRDADGSGGRATRCAGLRRVTNESLGTQRRGQGHDRPRRP